MAYCPPGRAPVPLGVLLVADETLFTRFRADWLVVDPEDLDVIYGVIANVGHLEKELGGPTALISYFEDTLSNVLQVSERRHLPTGDPIAALEQVYFREIGAP